MKRVLVIKGINVKDQTMINTTFAATIDAKRDIEIRNMLFEFILLLIFVFIFYRQLFT